MYRVIAYRMLHRKQTVIEATGEVGVEAHIEETRHIAMT
jgi:hypothetical protein